MDRNCWSLGHEVSEINRRLDRDAGLVWYESLWNVEDKPMAGSCSIRQGPVKEEIT